MDEEKLQHDAFRLWAEGLVVDIRDNTKVIADATADIKAIQERCSSRQLACEIHFKRLDLVEEKLDDHIREHSGRKFEVRKLWLGLFWAATLGMLADWLMHIFT